MAGPQQLPKGALYRAPPVYRFVGTALGASMWFFLMYRAKKDGTVIHFEVPEASSATNLALAPARCSLRVPFTNSSDCRRPRAPGLEASVGPLNALSSCNEDGLWMSAASTDSTSYNRPSNHVTLGSQQRDWDTLGTAEALYISRRRASGP
ncbi:hypothetical protein RB597_000754 [Gaeumannomyces tritici]